MSGIYATAPMIAIAIAKQIKIAAANIPNEMRILIHTALTPLIVSRLSIANNPPIAPPIAPPTMGKIFTNAVLLPQNNIKINGIKDNTISYHFTLAVSWIVSEPIVADTP